MHITWCRGYCILSHNWKSSEMSKLVKNNLVKFECILNNQYFYVYPRCTQVKFSKYIINFSLFIINSSQVKGFV